MSITLSAPLKSLFKPQKIRNSKNNIYNSISVWPVKIEENKIYFHIKINKFYIRFFLVRLRKEITLNSRFVSELLKLSFFHGIFNDAFKFGTYNVGRHNIR
jgi:hypothetical protein